MADDDAPTDEDDEERAVYIISVAAELAGVHPQTLRIYERKGLAAARSGPRATPAATPSATSSCSGRSRSSRRTRDQPRGREGDHRDAGASSSELRRRVAELEEQLARRRAIARPGKRDRREIVPLRERLPACRGRTERAMTERASGPAALRRSRTRWRAARRTGRPPWGSGSHSGRRRIARSSASGSRAVRRVRRRPQLTLGHRGRRSSSSATCRPGSRAWACRRASSSSGSSCSTRPTADGDRDARPLAQLLTRTCSTRRARIACSSRPTSRTRRCARVAERPGSGSRACCAASGRRPDGPTRLRDVRRSRETTTRK